MVTEITEQVPQSRLTWPALLEHPFVKESTMDVDEKVLPFSAHIILVVFLVPVVCI